MKPVFIVIIVIVVLAAIVGGIFLTIALVNKSKSAAIVTNTHDVDEPFNKLNIDLATAALEITVSADDKVKVICDEKEKVYHSVSVDDNTLKIKVEDKREWHEKLLFSLKRMKVTVYLPEGAYGDLLIDSAVGNVKVADKLTFNSIMVDIATGEVEINSNVNQSIEVDGATGSVKINNVTARGIDISSSTGSVIFNKVNVTNNIEIDCSTGKITLTDVTCQNLTTDVSTGETKFIRTIVAEKIKAESSTGSIIFDKSDAASLDIQATTGSIKGTLLTSKIFQATSEMGSINVPNTTTGGICKLKTTVGSIDIQISE
ncbi:MAG TPA: DUF4097 family beta strand repeat-containing protein [Clostridia bacterium]|jgi:DUF4097 and DUF4098 domain-containing protein YvlB|nr:DUF4097 family beta strand repeat-containing protein [Clostridia bacterium]